MSQATSKTALIQLVSNHDFADSHEVDVSIKFTAEGKSCFKLTRMRARCHWPESAAQASETLLSIEVWIASPSTCRIRRTSDTYRHLVNVISTAVVVNHDDTVDKKMLDVPDFYRMFTSNWHTVADSPVTRYTVEACRRQSLVRSSET